MLVTVLQRQYLFFQRCFFKKNLHKTYLKVAIDFHSHVATECDLSMTSVIMRLTTTIDVYLTRFFDVLTVCGVFNSPKAILIREYIMA